MNTVKCSNKQEYFILFLYIRKLLRTKYKNRSNLQNIPLLLSKFEILPNLFYQYWKINFYIAFGNKEGSLQIQDLRKDQIRSVQTSANEILDFYCNVIQFDNYNCMASYRGKLGLYQIRQPLIEKFYKLDQMDGTRLVYDFQRKLVYALHVWNSQESQIFNLKSNQIINKKISTIPETTQGSGTTCLKDNIYIFGGYLITKCKMSHDIQYFNLIQQEWKVMSAIFQNQSHVVQSLYVKSLNTILLFELWYLDSTYIFDESKIIVHGQMFPIQAHNYLNVQPVENYPRVYNYVNTNEQFQYKLYGYDLKNGIWQLYPFN